MDLTAVTLHFIGHDRPRPDKAHIAAKDVPELRQLVEARHPEIFSKPMDARVVDQLLGFIPFGAPHGVVGENAGQPRIGVLPHERNFRHGNERP
ncbi:hypothetical protein AJ87_21815 [Rhizobium yanglingense]|nr:hypothetical protein AJ87_21815 [Rhizobium yanglingense]